jgi:hypothetical protein
VCGEGDELVRCTRGALGWAWNAGATRCMCCTMNDNTDRDVKYDRGNHTKIKFDVVANDSWLNKPIFTRF